MKVLFHLQNLKKVINTLTIFLVFLNTTLVICGNQNNFLLKSPIFPQDTIKNNIITEDSIFPVDDTILLKSEQFYDTLSSRTEHRKILGGLLNLLLEKNGKKINNKENSNYDSFKKYNGRTIRYIYFRRLDVFGPTVYDTSATSYQLAQKAGNAIHVKTSRRILYKNLLFKSGDKLNPFTLADNERIYRLLPFIEDARILVRPVKGSDLVDIEVITKDVWPYGIGLDISSVNSGKFGINYENILGYGHEFRNNIFWLTSTKPLLGYEGIYRINNIGGSFINSEFRYMANHGTTTYHAEFERKFLTPEMKYAGGLKFEDKKTTEDIEIRDSLLEKKFLDYNYFNAWFGRAFQIKGNGFPGKRSTVMVAARFYQINFFNRPDLVSMNFLHNYQNRKLALFSIGFAKQGFTKGSLIYSFGRTEDIPEGRMIQFIGGYEYNEFKNRPYAGVSVSNGFISTHGHYLYNRVSLGGYYENHSIEQGTFDFTTRYFTRLYSLKRYKFRYFVNINYAVGLNLFQDEYYTIENREGLTGLKSDLLKGGQKLALNLENVAFSPYYINGFRFAFFGFVNMGMVNNNTKSFIDSKVFTGFGLGIRLRNERLIFKTLQVKLAYYPVAPSDATYQYIQFSGEERPAFENFYISSPAIIGSREF